MEYLFRYEYISESADRGGAIVMNWQIASEAEQEEEEEVNSGSSVKSFDRWHRYHHLPTSSSTLYSWAKYF